MADYKELAMAIRADNPDLSSITDDKALVDAVIADNPEVGKALTVAPSQSKEQPKGFKRFLSMLSNIPEDALNVARGIGETALAGAEVTSGQVIPRLLMGKKPAIIDVVKNIPSSLGASAQRLAGAVQSTGIPLPYGNPEENVAAAEKAPVSTVMDALMLVGGAKGLGKLRSPLSEGVLGKEPINVKELGRGESLISNLREPAEFARTASKDYGKSIGKIYDDFKQQMTAVEKLNPDKVVDIGDMALEWAADGDIRLPSKLQAIAEGSAPSAVTLSELQQIKNDITGRLSEKKLGGEYRSIDVPRLELINDINKTILGTFKEMRPVYDAFKTKINAAKSIKQLRKPETALDFIKNQENDVKLENAVPVLSPEITNAIREYRTVSRIGIPKTKLKLGEVLKRNPLKPKGK